MQFKALRVLYFMVALVGAAMTGVHHFIGLLQDCKGQSLIACVWPATFPPNNTKPKGVSTKDAPSQGAPSKGLGIKDRPPRPEQVPETGPQQTREVEAMLMWTGYVDGEIGRITKADFDKAVRRFQTSLGSDVGDKLSDSQRKALEDRNRNERARWQFRKVQNPLAAGLSLPTKLLPTSRILKYGHLYGSDDDDFSVEVVQLTASERSLESVREVHSRGTSGRRRLEGPIIERSDGVVTGFELSAIEGNERISVRAFQKDNVIRLLAITYNVERDKEFRALRNAIGSSYIPFGPTAGEDRVVSCANEGPDRASCNDKPERNVWKSIVNDP